MQKEKYDKALYYYKLGKYDKATKLFKELKDKYPEVKKYKLNWARTKAAYGDKTPEVSKYLEKWNKDRVAKQDPGQPARKARYQKIQALVSDTNKKLKKDDKKLKKKKKPNVTGVKG